MDAKPLPVTVTAVDADLRARANFRGIDERGQVHYLLGMCEALLAESNREIMRLRLTPPPYAVRKALREATLKVGR